MKAIEMQVDPIPRQGDHICRGAAAERSGRTTRLNRAGKGIDFSRSAS